MRLVADIGGTNARLAMSQNGAVLPETVRNFRNDDFDGFLTLARQYLSHHDGPKPVETVVAVAGPVWGLHAKLTNRDWRFDAEAIAAELSLSKAVLINDLNALGHALPALRGSQVVPIYHAEGAPVVRTQSLVVGVGTGFNVCPVLHRGDRVETLEVEFGHVSLPAGVTAAAKLRYGDISDMFQTVEECFSGRGYKALLDRGGTKEDYALLLAALARDLMMAFMPRTGLYFNGGVARSVLASPAQSEFVRAFAEPFSLAPDLSVPVCLINDDSAALVGCARVGVSRTD